MANIDGSDHCPVRAQFDVSVIAADKCPQLATKYFPQFAGRQQSLATFFSKKTQEYCSCLEDECWTENESGSQCSKTSSQHLSQDLPASVSSSSSSSKHCATLTEPVDMIREGNDFSNTIFMKKAKFSDSLANGGGSKQTSLLTFFTKPPSQSDNMCQAASLLGSSSINSVHCSTRHQRGELAVTDAKPCNTDTASQWKNLLKGPPAPPLCKGHQEPCVLRTVKKDGPNKGKQFWVCCRPEGPKSNTQARCDHFVWLSNKKC